MISFSQATKEEIAQGEIKNKTAAQHELVGFLLCNVSIIVVDKKVVLELKTSNAVIARRLIIIIKQIGKIKVDIITRKQSGISKNTTFIFRIADNEALQEFLQMSTTQKFNFKTEDFKCLELSKKINKKSFLKGCFLAAGSINNPNKGYSLQIPLDDQNIAKSISKIMKSIELNAKTVLQQDIVKVYIKEGESIANLLVFLDAPIAMTTFEDVRIIREMRNEANRMNNIEIANTEKSYNASLEIIAKLKKLEANNTLDEFSLKEQVYARFRMEKPDLSLQELAELLNESGHKASKSSLNHFFRKVKEKYDEQENY